jgi:hypothetical protein
MVARVFAVYWIFLDNADFTDASQARILRGFFFG